MSSVSYSCILYGKNNIIIQSSAAAIDALPTLPKCSVERCTTTNPYTNRRVVALVILVLFRFLLKHGYPIPLNCVVADSGLFRTSINPRWWLAANPTAAFCCLESSVFGLCTYLRYDCRWIDGECPGKRHRMWAN